MHDPLADSRAHDLLAAQPADVGVLAGRFRAAAAEAQRIAVGLRAAQRDGLWTGSAANAFRRSIGRLPADLDAVCVGFDGIGDALAAYEPELARLKAAFRRTVGEPSDAGGTAFAVLDEFAEVRADCQRGILAADRTAPRGLSVYGVVEIAGFPGGPAVDGL